jgi:hypothetical protein
VREQSAKVGSAIVDGRELKLSNLAKVLYPSTGFSKQDLIDYYTAIAPVLIGHLAGRPLTVKRWPDGVEGKSFFQKHAPANRPEWVRTAAVASERKPIDYVLAGDLPTLVWLANLAAIELHTPLARAEATEPRRARVRPRPRRAREHHGVLPRQPAAAGDVREPRPGELRQDVRLQGTAGVHPAQPRGRHLRADKDVRKGGRRAARRTKSQSWWSRA